MRFSLESATLGMLFFGVLVSCGRTTRDRTAAQSLGGAAGAHAAGGGGAESGGSTAGGTAGTPDSGTGTGGVAGTGGAPDAGGAAGTTSIGGLPAGGASGNQGGSVTAGAGAGGMGGEGPLENGEVCSMDAECASGVCHMAASNDMPVPPRTCDYCLELFRYDQWCDDDVDCCSGLSCGFGELAGLCVTN